MLNMRPRRRTLVVTACAVFLVAALAVVVLWEPAAPSAPAVTTNPSALEYPPTPWLDRIPLSWGWAWRLRDQVFARKVITLDSRLLALDRTARDLASVLPPPMPGPWESDGVRLWLFGEAEQSRFIELLEGQVSMLMSAPRVTTADDIQASATMGVPMAVAGGTQFVGVDVTFYPRVLATGTDLTLAIIATEAVTNRLVSTTPSQEATDVITLQTNLVLGARVLVPKQGGLLLLKRGPVDSNEKSYGLLISVDVPSHKP